jgi:hypothetical protein
MLPGESPRQGKAIVYNRARVLVAEFRMRAHLLIAVIAAGLAAATSVRASDLPLRPAPCCVGYYAPIGQPAGQIVIVDDEPGVVVRAYWASPWQGRHYFPYNGRRPRVGRFENLAARRPRPVPARTFYRSWSTNDLRFFPRSDAYVPPPSRLPPK